MTFDQTYKVNDAQLEQEHYCEYLRLYIYNFAVEDVLKSNIEIPNNQTPNYSLIYLDETPLKLEKGGNARYATKLNIESIPYTYFGEITQLPGGKVWVETEKEINPQFKGEIVLWIENKSTAELIIKKGDPIVNISFGPLRREAAQVRAMPLTKRGGGWGALT